MQDQLLRKIPNWITTCRIALIPLYVFLMVNSSETAIVAATVVFIFAAITDYLDGFIARRYRASSDFGKLLDPLADKILVMAALVMLAAQRSDLSGEPWVPGWMVVLILAREIWITGLRAVAAAEGTVVAASSAGKLKSGLQMAGIIILHLHEMSFYVPGRQVTFQLVGFNVLLVSIFISYWGAYEYSREILGFKMGQSDSPGDDSVPPPSMQH